MYPVIIGITGRKYNGKDTMADFLVQNYGYTKLAFAEPLKEAAIALFGFSHEQVYGDLKEVIDPRWGVSPRQVMQFIGTELIRENIGKLLPHIGENFWVHCVLTKIQDRLSKDPNAKFVISDVRFPNEIECIRKLNITSRIFRIQRPDLAENTDSLHASEILIDTLPVDEVIINDSNKETLYNKIKDLFLIES